MISATRSSVRSTSSTPLPPLHHDGGGDNAADHSRRQVRHRGYDSRPGTAGLREERLIPVCDEWYPLIVKMLPSDGFTAPEHFTIQFKTMGRGFPAATGGTQISCNSAWFKRNLQGEALGAVVHKRWFTWFSSTASRNNAAATRNPGWMVEGLADYIRWFKYEPQTHGADIRSAANAKFDGSYRVTANFLNWVIDKYNGPDCKDERRDA